MSNALTFFFAWVQQSDRAWNPSFARNDENVFSLEIKHDEGQIPTCDIEIKNPRIGLINPGRAYWSWLSYSFDGGPPIPLFFGRLVGIPSDLQGNVLKIQLIARDVNYIPEKQAVAETLKVLPQYDPVFFDVAKRDDPDAILEGWSALYHVDRVSGRVSASDILVGEDGTIVFAQPDVFYDSVKMKVLQSPLIAVNVQAEATWKQQYTDHFYLGAWAYPTLGSDAFVGDWPKSGTKFGGGWSAGASWAGERDPSIGTALAATMMPGTTSVKFHYQNLERKHTTGDTMTVDMNQTLAPPGFKQILLRMINQVGIVDPYAVDFDGDPAPVNVPAHVQADYFCYRTFALDFLGKESLATMGIVYEAARQRTERIELTVQSDVQPILIDPLVTEDTEQITLKSGDLSLPIIAMLNWSSVASKPVALGEMIFPDNPLVPGQTSSQICIRAGTAGATEPVFSNIAGQVTADGTVLWSSLGGTQPTEGAQDWLRDAPISLGTLIIPRPVMGVPDIDSIQAAGQLNYPPSGVPIAKYTPLSNGYSGPLSPMFECVQSGILGGLSPVQAVFQGFTNPSGRTMLICVQAGRTGDFRPVLFNEAAGALTTDGSVVWKAIGPVSLPIGGWPGITPARSYFPTDRGRQSVEHLLCRARAKLRRRARAVQISFDTRFEVAAMASCRMNGRVTDPRLPGGTVSGKIISYSLKRNGDTGETIGNVTIGCSIGNTPTVG
jgi:hypothetical protein